MYALALSFRPLLLLACGALAVLTLSRLTLMIVFYDRVMAVDAVSLILLQGLRFDLVMIGMLLILPTIVAPLLVTHPVGLAVWKVLMYFWVPALFMVLLFMELATIPFIEQFDVRPNILFFEYAGHPKEIFATLMEAYRVPLMAGTLVTLSMGWWMFKKTHSLLEHSMITPWAIAVPCVLVLSLLLGSMIRSTSDHRPVNPSVVARTTDTLVNDLALSSIYTVGYAAYAMKDEEAGVMAYGHMDSEEATQIVRQSMAIDESLFLGSETTHRNALASVRSKRPKNLVIILQESLGAEFVGSLGGLGVTPNIDALSNEGMWFERLYATGTRSVRGIEAVMTGFPPTPARSVVKLNKSQSGFFSLASALSEHGYDTSFIYGGESHFDNMRRFFVGNGVQRIVDENDYENPAFTGSWGVSDEDLMRRAHQEFETMGDKPFFSLVFSSSNHTPFEFPDGRIELFDQEKQTVNNAVKYADYAIGEFFKLAKESNYWKDTVFLVVADHNSRVYGDSLVPIERFHIPGLILGGSVNPSRYSRIASQIDLGPTLLSMIGVDTISPMPGRDLTVLGENVPGRAMMQFNAVNAYMEEDKVAILRRDLSAATFLYREGKLIGIDDDDRLQRKALAFVTWASETYHKRSYNRLPVSPDSDAQQLVDASVGDTLLRRK